jgi:hypothetical protein
MSTGRKVFHCAVDQTALTTNISEIKKWTTNGAITLIVPLYSKCLLFLTRLLLLTLMSFLAPQPWSVCIN